MNRLIFFAVIIFIYIAVQAQVNVYPNYTKPYFQSNVKVRDTLSAKTIITNKIITNGNITADTIKNTVLQLQPNELNFSYANSYLFFNDSTVTIPVDTTLQITNDYDSLWRVIECNNIEYLKGDTLVIQYKGIYNIFIYLKGNYYSSMGNNYLELSMKYKSGDTIYESDITYPTVTTNTFYSVISGFFCQHFEVGDKIWFTLTNTGIYNYILSMGKINILQYSSE